MVRILNLDIRPLLRGETNLLPVNFSLSPEPIDNITFTDSAQFTGKITDAAGYMKLSLHAELPFEAECARCLSPVKDVFLFDFEKAVAQEGTLSIEEEESDDYIIAKDGFLDVDELLREMLILEFPNRILCDENCPGMCPKCGKPRREGPCSCETKEIDPRLAILQKLLDK